MKIIQQKVRLPGIMAGKFRVFIDPMTPCVSQLNNSLSFSILHHPDALRWLEDSELEYDLNSDDHLFPMYNVEFRNAADAALFKLIWC